MCSIYLDKLLFKVKEMKKNVKQKAVKRQDSVGNVSLKQCCFFLFTREKY